MYAYLPKSIFNCELINNYGNMDIFANLNLIDMEDADKYFTIECEYPGPLANRCKRNELIYIQLRRSVGSKRYFEHKSPMTIDDCNSLTKRFNRTSKKFKKTICEKSKGKQNG